MKKNTLRNVAPAILTVALVFAFVVLAKGQVSSKDVETAVNSEWTTWKGILRIILNIVIAIGGIGLIAAYATNRNESKDHLTKWVIAIILISILRITVLA